MVQINVHKDYDKKKKKDKSSLIGNVSNQITKLLLRKSKNSLKASLNLLKSCLNLPELYAMIYSSQGY